MSESVKERELRREAARSRRKAAQRLEVLVEYRDRELRRMVERVMPWDVFERLIGIENVIDQQQRINLEELVVRINAEHNVVPHLVPRRVTRTDFKHDG